MVTDGRVHMRAMAQWWAAPTRRTMFARDMHARVRRQARPCQRLPWESRARVSSRPVRRQELDGCRARSTTAVKPRSRVDASRRTFCHHLHESVQCTHWPDAGPRRLNRAPSQADLALLRRVTPAGASLGETASAVPTAGWKYLASFTPQCRRGAGSPPFVLEVLEVDILWPRWERERVFVCCVG